MMDEDAEHVRLGRSALARVLVALGQIEDAKIFLALVHRSSDWGCDRCKTEASCAQAVGMCEYCLQIFCGNCIEKLGTPQFNRFCVPGHSLIGVPADDGKHAEVVFRGRATDLQDCVNTMRSEWGI